MVFADRDDAGRQLAAQLGHLKGAPVVVLGLPRGGVRVAFQVARALGAPLDVIVVRKLGVPFQPELGMGAVGEDGARVTNPEIVDLAGASEHALAAGPARGQAEGGARAGWYRPARPRAPGGEQEGRPEAGVVRLAGYLTVPENAPGIVVFAHGSGSSRHSPRNRYVAGVLNEAGLGTLLFDLLTPEEEADRANVFDIGLLAGRLAEVTGWPRAQPRAAHAPIGSFGASTGAAAALWAAAEPGSGIAAVVSRGGRPDLARPRLAAVTAPTLLIVGGRDEVVLDLNQRAQAELRCENGLAVVPGATHLFEEPGTLAAAAGLARDWFISHLTR